METFYRSNLWKVILVLLVVVNVGTLALFWYTRLHHPAGLENGRQKDAGEFIIHELKLDKEQVKAFEKLRGEHRDSVEAIRARIRIGKDNFFSHLGDQKITELQLDSLTAATGKEEAELDRQTFLHFQKVRAICTPAQQAKFDNIIQDLLRMMAPPQPGQGPPQDSRGTNGPPQDRHNPPPPGGKRQPEARRGPPPGAPGPPPGEYGPPPDGPPPPPPGQ